MDCLDYFGRSVGRWFVPLLLVTPLWIVEHGPVPTQRFATTTRTTLRGLFYQHDNYSAASSSRNAGAGAAGSTAAGTTSPATTFSIWEAPHGMCSGARHVSRTRWYVADDMRFFDQSNSGGLCASPMYAQFGLTLAAAALFRLGAVSAAAPARGERGPVAIRGALLWLAASLCGAAAALLYARQYGAQVTLGAAEQSMGGYYGYGPAWYAVVLVYGGIGGLCGVRRLLVATSIAPALQSTPSSKALRPKPPPPPPLAPPPPPMPASAADDDHDGASTMVAIKPSGNTTV